MREVARAKTQAEFDAQREVQQAKVAEREGVGAAAEDVVDAVDEHQTSVQVGDSANAEADRIRRQAEQLTNEADLP